MGLVRIFDFSEAGFASGWSADILVRSVPGLNTEADRNVRAPNNRRCAHWAGPSRAGLAEPRQEGKIAASGAAPVMAGRTAERENKNRATNMSLKIVIIGGVAVGPKAAANVARNKLDGLMTGISSLEVKRWLDAKDDFVFLDVRSPGEHQQERLPGAVSIPLGVLRSRFHELPKDREIVAFCKVSLRGYEAARILQAAGFTRVRIMEGGVVA
jgi:rhodanese-related sulfurtransferase